MRRLIREACVPGDRRREPRWLDRRLLLARIRGSEVPGLSGDISLGGMRFGLSCRAPPVGALVDVAVAFAQDVIVVRGYLVHASDRRWGSLVGIRYAARQEAFRRFVTRRYPFRPLASG